MGRNTGCENSDGCSTAVLKRLVVDPWRRREERADLSPWLNDRSEVPSPPETGIGGTGGCFPTFELGEWRFTVKTHDLHLVEDLKAFVGDIAFLPRSDRKFTFKLVRCTEEGRLGGWAWQKERVPVT